MEKRELSMVPGEGEEPVVGGEGGAGILRNGEEPGWWGMTEEELEW